jgi:Surface adhesin CshA non-repetitive domain 2
VLPTYSAAFLGNDNDGTPFYTGITSSAKPALYQTAAGTTYATFTNISVVSPSGQLATGWEAVSADAESTDINESITWTTNEGTVNPNYTPPDLYTIPNNQQPTDTNDNSIVGNACEQGAGLTGSTTNTVECNGGQNTTSGEKTGTAMVYAVSPSYMKVTMVGSGLEAITFGLMLS